MGFSAGIGAGLPIKDKFNLELEIRYNQGLLNFDNNPYSTTIFDANEVGNGRLVNGSVCFLLGLRYGLSK